MKLSKARINRASVRGKILMLRFWGSEYGKVVRLTTRRALIITKSGITPVRLKGK